MNAVIVEHGCRAAHDAGCKSVQIFNKSAISPEVLRADMKAFLWLHRASAREQHRCRRPVLAASALHGTVLLLLRSPSMM